MNIILVKTCRYNIIMNIIPIDIIPNPIGVTEVTWLTWLTVPITKPNVLPRFGKICAYMLIFIFICGPIYFLLKNTLSTEKLPPPNQPIYVIYAFIFGWIILLFWVALLS